MKRAYLVSGPESSGNRYVARLLIAAGCIGDGGHAQRWDANPPTNQDPIVWIQSLPHGGRWPPLAAILTDLRGSGYATKLIVPIREWNATIRSQMSCGHVATVHEGWSNIQRAFRWLFASLFECGDVPYLLLSMEGLVLHPAAVLDEFYKFVELPMPAAVEWPRDENGKWYKD